MQLEDLIKWCKDQRSARESEDLAEQAEKFRLVEEILKRYQSVKEAYRNYLGTEFDSKGGGIDALERNIGRILSQSES